MTPHEEHAFLYHKTTLHAAGDGRTTIETCDTCGARWLHDPLIGYPVTMRPLVKVAGIQCTLERSEPIDGILYELYNDPVFNGGVIRTYDREAGELVQIKKFPTFYEARRQYDELVDLVRTL